MERLIIEKLIQWKNAKNRKPLILKGMRQCGKTWILREFGQRFYDNTAYFNFDEQTELIRFFETTKDPKRLLENLTFLTGAPILPGQTLIIFDEIQESDRALNALKYFCENAPEYHVACAGSLLGITLTGPSGFPVGKVDFLEMYPMTFTEFLLATGNQNLVDYLNSHSDFTPIPDIFFNPLVEKLKMYFITGGMPEAVKAWAQDQDPQAVEYVLKNILDAYAFDFAKHADPRDFPKIQLIWQSIPSQLSRENKKFLYSAVKKGARAREYESALDWLTAAGLIYKTHRITKPGLPLAAYDDLSAFKIYMADIGLLRRKSQLSPTVFAESSRLFTEFKGALTENYVLQSLIPQFETPPRYWSSENRAEVDFILHDQNNCYPIEVKAGESLRGKSLQVYDKTYHPPLKIRFSMKNIHREGTFLNLPLFMADYLEKYLALARA